MRKSSCDRNLPRGVSWDFMGIHGNYCDETCKVELSGDVLKFSRDLMRTINQLDIFNIWLAVWNMFHFFHSVGNVIV